MTIQKADLSPCMHKGSYTLLEKIRSSQQSNTWDYGLV